MASEYVAPEPDTPVTMAPVAPVRVIAAAVKSTTGVSKFRVKTIVEALVRAFCVAAREMSPPNGVSAREASVYADAMKDQVPLFCAGAASRVRTW